MLHCPNQSQSISGVLRSSLSGVPWEASCLDTWPELSKRNRRVYTTETTGPVQLVAGLGEIRFERHKLNYSQVSGQKNKNSKKSGILLLRHEVFFDAARKLLTFNLYHLITLAFPVATTCRCEGRDGPQLSIANSKFRITKFWSRVYKVLKRIIRIIHHSSSMHGRGQGRSKYESSKIRATARCTERRQKQGKA